MSETGYTFGMNQGLSPSNSLIDPDHYSIEMIFRLTDLSDYRKILDFRNLTRDAGLHNLNTSLNFDPAVTGPNSALSQGTIVHVLITRDGVTDQVDAYVNGTRHLTFADSGDAVFSGPDDIIQFFKDDFVTGQSRRRPWDCSVTTTPPSRATRCSEH